MKVAVTRRPIVIETRTSAAILQETLARMETIKGRASGWGIVNNDELSALWAGDSIEADFTRSYYREGFVEGGAPEFLPGWAFSRTGAGTARTVLGRLVSFVSGAPRITDMGLLIEAASTNWALRSNDIGASPWTGNVTPTSGFGLAPDGTTTSTRLVAGTADAYWVQTFIDPEPSGVYSIFVKKGSGPTQANTFWLRDYGTNSNPIACTVNYDTGAVTYQSGAGPAQMERYADGWWRLDLAAVGTLTVGEPVGLFAGFAFNTGEDGHWCEVWGAQFEAGRTAPTSLIVTTSATATRGSDLATLDGALAAGAGTVLTEFRRGRQTALEEAIVGDNDGNALLYVAGAGAFSYVNQVGLPAGSAPASFAISKAAATWGPDLRRVGFGAAPSVTDAAGGPSGSQLQIGSQTSAWRLGGYVRRLLITPQRANEDQLEAMTT